MNNTYHDPSDIFYRKNDRTFLFLIVLTVLVWEIPLLVVPEVIHNDSVEYIRLAKYILTDTDGPNALYPLLTVTSMSLLGTTSLPVFLFPLYSARLSSLLSTISGRSCSMRRQVLLGPGYLSNIQQ